MCTPDPVQPLQTRRIRDRSQVVQISIGRYAATRHANAYLEHGVEPEHQIVASAN